MTMNQFSDVAKLELIATDALKKLAQHISRAENRETPASGYAPLREILSTLKVEEFLKHGGMDQETFASFLDNYLRHSVQLHNPAFIAHQVSVPDYPGVLAGMINAALNNPMAIYEMGPAAASLEFRVVNWMLEKIGWTPEPFPDTVDEDFDRSSHAAGVLVHGGSLANLTAMLAARARIAPQAWTQGTPKDLAIMVPKVSHYSNERAVAILGLGTNAIYPIDVDAWGVVQVESLEKTYAKLSADGKRCMAVIANASSTATGLHDPLVAMGEFCQQHGLWFHIDACHGATALLSQNSRHFLDGIELGDSVVWDAHKMMQVPVLCAAALFKNATDLMAAFHQDASYLAYGENREGYDSVQRAIECTKASLSLKIFLNLAFMGEKNLGAFVDDRYAMASKFYEILKTRPNFIAPYQPETNILCFRYQGADGKASDD
ncbi:MAG: aminotransferase class V-fold PLP-dependent enzyme, partial [Gammaproteobacteria bacterium]|nr:aminotransferase class V-fold PLP-dependent enzyme [Gammaproteobacteria bacterium]